MKILIVYDTLYGNTEKIARSIGGAFTGDVKILKVGEANVSEMDSVDLFIVGSPTQGGRDTKPMQEFITQIPEATVRRLKIAVFDTRLATKLVKLFGYAEQRINSALKSKGATFIVPSAGFTVKSAKGPLLDGELEKAAAWGKKIIAALDEK
jgi:flavodoxin I